jgi:hypothetical protein
LSPRTPTTSVRVLVLVSLTAGGIAHRAYTEDELQKEVKPRRQSTEVKAQKGRAQKVKKFRRESKRQNTASQTMLDQFKTSCTP